MLNNQLNKNFNYLLTSLFLVCFLFFYSAIASGKTKQVQQTQISTPFAYKKLVTPNPSVEAQALFRYLQNISGEKILSGQMCSPVGINEIEYIANVTGKQPALRGFDFEHSRENEKEIQNTIKWWAKGGIPVIMWNWGAPAVEDSYEKSRKKINIEKCFEEGTPEYESFWQELTIKANYLEVLRDTNVAVLWNPFHEQNGEQFWWGKQGSAQFQKLWQIMFNYFVHERKLNNLIWVSNLSEDINKAWIPGRDFVDIIGVGSLDYNSDQHGELYGNVRELADNIVAPITFQQCASIPSPNECREKGTMWCWWLQRAATYLQEIDQTLLFEIYNHDMIVTLDEVPDITKHFSTKTVKRDFKSGMIIPFTELKEYGIGTKSNESSIHNNQLKIITKGKGSYGKKDETYFTFKQTTGDFDISTQVLSISATQSPSTAGIMARVDLSKGSQHVFFAVLSGNNPNLQTSGFTIIHRDQKSRQSKYLNSNIKSNGNKANGVSPNVWIRLKRRGNFFKSYISFDNSNWQIFSVHKQKMPERLLLGLAVSSNNSPTNTQAEFKDLEITWE